jgi:hypothetical protein
VRAGYEAAVVQLKRIGRLFDAVEFDMTKALNANNHIMGGTIMGSDPKDSVVEGPAAPTTIRICGCRAEGRWRRFGLAI